VADSVVTAILFLKSFIGTPPTAAINLQKYALLSSAMHLGFHQLERIHKSEQFQNFNPVNRIII